MSSDFVTDVLTRAHLSFQLHWTSPPSFLYLTEGNQLIGTYAALRRFAQATPSYRGWQAHHIVEHQDLARLGMLSGYPEYADQVCVLLPSAGHISRINSVLRQENPQGATISSGGMFVGYQSAYWLLGDYCGSGEEKVQAELLAIARVILGR